MTRRFSISPGVAVNQDEVVRSLKERGFYSSSIPRTECDAAPPAREREAAPKKARWPSREVLRYMSDEDFNRFIHDAMRDEGNNPHG